MQALPPLTTSPLLAPTQHAVGDAVGGEKRSIRRNSISTPADMNDFFASQRRVQESAPVLEKRRVSISVPVVTLTDVIITDDPTPPASPPPPKQVEAVVEDDCC
jgi:hypothetical protein